MYKIVHGLVYFPPNIFVNRIGRTPNTTRPFLYSCPYAHTTYYQYSFVPRTVSAWNALPSHVVAVELCSFKSNVPGCIFKLAHLLLFYVPFCCMTFNGRKNDRHADEVHVEITREGLAHARLNNNKR